MPGLFSFDRLAQTAQKQGRYLDKAARMMVGVPDCDQYCRHMRTTHSDRTPMTDEEFFKNRVQAHYGSGRGGCC